jgi:hypothetical protein
MKTEQELASEIESEKDARRHLRNMSSPSRMRINVHVAQPSESESSAPPAEPRFDKKSGIMVPVQCHPHLVLRSIFPEFDDAHTVHHGDTKGACTAASRLSGYKKVLVIFTFLAGLVRDPIKLEEVTRLTDWLESRFESRVLCTRKRALNRPTKSIDRLLELARKETADLGRKLIGELEELFVQHLSHVKIKVSSLPAFAMLLATRSVSAEGVDLYDGLGLRLDLPTVLTLLSLCDDSFFIADRVPSLPDESWCRDTIYALAVPYMEDAQK